MSKRGLYLKHILLWRHTCRDYRYAGEIALAMALVSSAMQENDEEFLKSDYGRAIIQSLGLEYWRQLREYKKFFKDKDTDEQATYFRIKNLLDEYRKHKNELE